jgi:cephalosporin hydroxylase
VRLILDDSARILRVEENGEFRELSLYSRDAFELLSREWLRLGWNQKYVYTFTWLGRPIIQLPEDLIRVQEVIYSVQPDVIVETGVAHGGSLVYYASLCNAIGRGRVVGVEVRILPENRACIQAHRLSSYITLIEGSSVDPEVVERVRALVNAGDRVLVVLDSNHTRDHVAAELEAYHSLVSPDSYIVATDGIMQELGDVPRGNPNWTSDNPAEAAREFALRHPEFCLEQPEWPFNESELRANVTHWPSAYLRRRRL